MSGYFLKKIDTEIEINPNELLDRFRKMAVERYYFISYKEINLNRTFSLYIRPHHAEGESHAYAELLISDFAYTSLLKGEIGLKLSNLFIGFGIVILFLPCIACFPFVNLSQFSIIFNLLPTIYLIFFISLGLSIGLLSLLAFLSRRKLIRDVTWVIEGMSEEFTEKQKRI